MKKALMWVSILTAIVLAVLNLTYQFGPEPDLVFPMANRGIEWTGK